MQILTLKSTIPFKMMLKGHYVVFGEEEFQHLQYQ